MYINRLLESSVETISSSFKVVYVGGPRQAGKTTLLRELAEKKGMNYVTLDNEVDRDLAERDPDLFLKKYPAPILIDEVQYASRLFSYIKIIVDNSHKKGQYWLTGSQPFHLLKNLSESLAGRVGILNLYGLSLAEIYKTNNGMPFWPDCNFENFEPIDLGLQTTFDHIFRGTFPLMHTPLAPPHSVFYNSYVKTYIDSDINSLFQIDKLQQFHRFMKLCAARVGQQVNYSNLAKDADISPHTAKAWLSVLEASGQVFFVQPYFTNLHKRLIKSAKLYFWDSGLVAHLLRYQDAESILNSQISGALFENFVVTEIFKSHYYRGETPDIYYIRDRDGHEVDLLFLRNQKLYPVEVKLNSLVNSDVVANMRYFGNDLPFEKGAVISLSDNYGPYNRQIQIVPVGYLN